MIYFDNSATTQPYPEVLETLVTVSERFFANPSSIHSLGGESERLITQARSMIAALLRIEQKEIIFTSGGTEANNLAIKGAALQHKKRGKHIISTSMEHASCFESFRQLEDLGYKVTYLPVTSTGVVTAEQIKSAIQEDTILVSVMHVNNELGTIQPVAEIGSLLQHYPKILFHVDHVQGVGKVPLDIHGAKIDLCSFSSHKFHGPKGIGFLFVREGVRLSPLLTGGSQEWKMRAGTENVPGIVAMTKALRITIEKADTGTQHLIDMTTILRRELEAIDGVMINTPIKSAAPHILNLSVLGIKPEVLIHALEEKEIYVSTKSACSSKAEGLSRVLLAAGIEEKQAESAIRISLSFNNTVEEVLHVIKTIKELIPQLKKVMG
jgi:cysteine desulfurase